MRRVLALLIMSMLLVRGGSRISAAEWGDLRGRIVYDGPVTAPAEIKVTSDQEVCCKHDLVVESLLVNPKNKGVRNVIVYLYQNKSTRRPTPEDKKPVPIHESYEALRTQAVKMDNNRCRFDPHVALVWTARKVTIGNSDPIGHNVKIDSKENRPSNDTIPAGGAIDKTFEQPEKLPLPVTCSIHPWMKGWLVIRDTPYMAVTDADGKFEIKNVPAGKWQFMFWQEAAGYVSKVKVDGRVEKWRRGITVREIKPGDNDMGDIVVSSDLFK